MEISDELGFALLRALPQKTDKIAADIVERQVVHRRKSHVFDPWLAFIAEIEKQGSIKFGEKIQIATTLWGISPWKTSGRYIITGARCA